MDKSRIIKVKEDTYNKLVARKGPATFDDVIRLLLKKVKKN